VLFDLDGTLLNTLKDLANAVNQSLRKMGFPEHRQLTIQSFIGEGREVLAALSLPVDHRDPATVDRLCELINRHYAEHWADHTRPYPGVPEMLDGLTEIGLRLAILSNKPQDFTEANVAGLLSRWCFDVIAGAVDGIPKKPDCTAALKIAHELNIRPRDFLYLGDSGIDMQTAVAACMYPVGALWGFRDAAELKKCGAQVLLEKPVQLLDLIKKRSKFSSLSA
jgi:phosphoglycolate phosphatase